jgi:GNAT superfamily N-acetyltransferase
MTGADAAAGGIVYAVEDRLDPAEMVDVFRRSGLAERRPVDDAALVERMAAGANLVVTARAGGLMVGLARSVTDFAYCVYLSDLATDRAWQGRGIGRRLIELTRDAAGAQANLILISAPGAMDFYAHVGPAIGLANVDSAWIIRR